MAQQRNPIQIVGFNVDITQEVTTKFPMTAGGGWKTKVRYDKDTWTEDGSLKFERDGAYLETEEGRDIIFTLKKGTGQRNQIFFSKEYV